jgi:hypothetical protein
MVSNTSKVCKSGSKTMQEVSLITTAWAPASAGTIPNATTVNKNTNQFTFFFIASSFWIIFESNPEKANIMPPLPKIHKMSFENYNLLKQNEITN